MTEKKKQAKRVGLSKAFKEFFSNEKTGGIILILCTILSLILSNTNFSSHYLHLWHFNIWGESTEHWINDGLMAVFFLLVGLELKRELLAGELSSIKKSSLPLVGAIGGMIVPALLFTLFNAGTPTSSGAGIPMATDIAFAIGILSLLGNRVPAALKILLTALAVIDDLGAIFVIAVFYTSSLAYINLFIALGIFILLMVLNKLKVKWLLVYLAGGIAMWYFMLHSGVHATITGVLLAITIPFNKGSENAASYKLQHWLEKPVTLFILPLFALANTSIVIGNDWYKGLSEPNSLGIFAGLMIGKPIGIFFFSLVAVLLKICSLPTGVKWKHYLGMGFIGGIGFTMSIFITLLAYDDPYHITEAKIAILLSSLFAGLLGFFWLRFTLPKSEKNTQEYGDYWGVYDHENQDGENSEETTLPS